jgi:tripartite-type tricarboxylate transporter receptor subunit TctC
MQTPPSNDAFAGFSRRHLMLGLGAAVVAPRLGAQTAWPGEKPIRIVVPFAPGGSTDVITRLIADEMRPRLNQTVVVENRPGAGGTLGTGQVAKAAPDGYTLVVSVISAFSVGSTLYRGRLDWDPDRSFAHIADTLRTPYALMAGKGQPFNSIAELVAHAKRQPGVPYATSGIGSIPHLVMMRFARAAGIELTHIPYKGGAQAVADVIGGQVPITLDGLAAAVPHLKSGALKGLGVTSGARSAGHLCRAGPPRVRGRRLGRPGRASRHAAARARAPGSGGQGGDGAAGPAGALSRRLVGIGQPAARRHAALRARRCGGLAAAGHRLGCDRGLSAAQRAAIQLP